MNFLALFMVIAAFIPTARQSPAIDKFNRTSPTRSSPTTDSPLFFLDYTRYLIHTINETLSNQNLFLSSRCQNDIKKLLTSARDNQLWALNMLDSFGKPVDIMNNDLVYLGSYSNCLNVVAPEQTFIGKYCLADIDITDETIKQWKTITNAENRFYQKSRRRMGICIPSTCKDSEFKNLLHKVLLKYLPNIKTNIDTPCVEKMNSFESDYASHIGIAIFAFIFLAYLICTFYDLSNETLRSFMKENKFLRPTHADDKFESTENDEKKQSKYSEILSAFSFSRNIKEILNFDAPKISSLDGIRVLSLMWIIIGHTWFFAFNWLSLNNTDKSPSILNNYFYSIFVNGNFHVDSFFLIGGFLVSLVGLKELRRTEKFNYFTYALYRFLRITPLMMAIIAFCATILRYIGDGPKWADAVKMYDPWCRQNWWVNLFYFQNIRNEDMCLSHSWYLAVDMQLYLLAPLIIIPLYKHSRMTIGVISALMLFSVSYIGYLTYANGLPAIAHSNYTVSPNMNDYYQYIYMNPIFRISPYLVGILLGYIIFTNETNLKLNKCQNLIGWTSSATILLAIFLSIKPIINGQITNKLILSSFSALSHTLWSISVAWIIYSCYSGQANIFNQFLSMKIFIPISRISFSAYLIHPIITAIFFGNSSGTFEFSVGFMIYASLGNIIISLMVSVFLTALFELPYVKIAKILLRSS